MSTVKSALPTKLCVLACDDCQSSTIAVLREVDDGDLVLAAWCPFCEKDVTDVDRAATEELFVISNYIN